MIERNTLLGMTTAFVLGGGGVLGATQVGMLRALLESGIHPDLVLGTSIGALNGCFAAADPTPAGAERLAEVWRAVAREGIFLRHPMRQAARMAKYRTHVLSHAPLQLILDRFLPVTEFADLAVPFQCVAARIEDCAGVWFHEGPLAAPVLASCSVPGLFPAVTIEGQHYLDGGLVHSIPVGRAVDLGASEIYVLQVGRIEQALTPPSGPFEVAQVAFEISRRHRYVHEIETVPPEIALHVLPSGTSTNPTVSIAQASRGRMKDRMDSAYAASIAYLSAQP